MTQSSAGTGASRTDGAAPSGLPLFYQAPEPVRADRHGDLALDTRPNFDFARGCHAVPINAVEFAPAARHYPIVFAANTTPPAAIAVLGLRRDQNVFVDADGAWKDDVYVPSYVRRYPFILARNDASTEFALCIDTRSGKLSKEGDTALFEDGEPTDATRKALEFCGAYQREARESEAVLAKLAEHDLLVPNEGRFTLPSGEVLTVADFQIVDENRLNALSDDAFLDLRKAGALSAIYCHLISMRNWPDLMRQIAAKAA